MSHVLKNGTVNPGSEVAAKVNDSWIHARVVQWNQDTKCYEVEDAHTAECYQVLPCNVIPLVMPQQAEIFEQGSRVLALFPQTTSFYAGTVVSNGNFDEYSVRFDHDVLTLTCKSHKVSSYFVVKHPSSSAAAPKAPKEETTQQKTPQQGKLKVEDALTYLAKVKGEFQDDPEHSHIFNLFLDIMKNFKSQQIDAPAVISQVSQLFRGHDHLILGFNTFLPPDQKITKQHLHKMNAQHEQSKKQQQHKNGKQEKGVPTQAAASSPPFGFEPSANKITKSSACASSPPFGFEHAITYVTKVKTRFERDSTEYTTFLDILHAYKEDKQSIEGVLEQVSELFRDHPDLLKEFAYFLPEAVQAQATARLAQAAAHYKKKRHEIPTTELPLDVESLKKKYDEAQKVAEEAQKIADDLLFRLNELTAAQEASKA
jgi:histone deacetylase complex regulatory component SIN3